MGLIEHLEQTNFSTTQQTAPEGYCPNCWGRQEYSGDFFQAIKNEGITTNNLSSKKGWILAYAEKYLTGIRLKQQGTDYVCTTCTTND